MDNNKKDFSMPLLTILSFNQKENYTTSDVPWSIGGVKDIPDIGSAE